MNTFQLLRGIVLAAILAIPGSVFAQTVFAYSSAPGDYIGQGETKAYTPLNATFSVSGTGAAISIHLDTGTSWWDVDLAAPAGQLFAPGKYHDAERTPFRTGRSPGLNVSGEGRGCNRVWGEFGIRQIRYDVAGKVIALEAELVQRCESDTSPPMAVVVRYKAPYLSLKLDSDPLDYIGGGISKRYFGDSTIFALSGTTSYLQYGVSGLRDDWMAIVTPPTGTKLRVRRYSTARFADATHAGLDFFGDGRGCNSSRGTLDVKKLVIDGKGNVLAAYMDFVQYCEGGTAALRGTIYHDPL